MYRILICDDDRDIREALRIYLSAEGYELVFAENGKEALEQVMSKDIHLILMDIMMPVMDGIAATVKLRETSNIPVIFLTAKSEEIDLILGLNVGGDDYVTKPFNPMEVLARVRSQIRRYTMLGGMKKQEEDVYIVGGVVLDDRAKKVTVDGEEVSLTKAEYNILKLLMGSPGKVFSSGEIYSNVWKERIVTGVESTVAVHIRHLREKIEITPSQPRYLQVVWGYGYKMEAREDKG